MEDWLLSKLQGTAVGAALGAAFGKAVHEVPGDSVASFYGKPITDFSKSHPSSPFDFLKPEEVPPEVEIFKIALETLVEAKNFEPVLFISKLIKWFENKEFHKYLNPTLVNVIRALKEGEELQEVYTKSSSISSILHTVSMGMFHYDYPTLAAEGAKLMALILARGKEIEEGAKVIGAATSILIEGEIDLSLENGGEQFIDWILESLPEPGDAEKYLKKVKEALRENLKLEEAINFFGNGEYIWESLPLSLYIFLKDARYPQRAFFNAVNSYGPYGGATAYIGFLVGAWIGAYWGLEVYPPQWVEKVELSKELLKLAEELYKDLTE
jgi:ADP-ribosylglycohydrolase